MTELISFEDIKDRCDFKLNVVDEDDLQYDFLDKFKGALIRSEYVVRDSGYYLTQEPALEAIRRLASATAERFNRYDIWYRISEFTTSEANALEGVEEIIQEKNELCGLRGIRRSLHYPDTFRKELGIIVQLSEKYPNLNILFSMIHGSDQVKQMNKILCEFEYKNKKGAMLEVPSSIILFEEIEPSFNNFIIGLNDITSFVLGAHRELKGVYDKTHPAVKRFLNDFIKKYGCDNSLELAGYIRAKEIEMGLELGIKSIYLRMQDLPFVFKEFKECQIKDRPYVKNRGASRNVSEMY